jgi:hypothetical protein
MRRLTPKYCAVPTHSSTPDGQYRLKRKKTARRTMRDAQYRARPTRSPCRSRTRPTLQGLPSAHPPDRAPARRLMRKTRSMKNGYIVSFHQTPLRLAPDTMPDA